MKMGRCEITGMNLFASDVYCHHYIPLYLGGSDRFNKMRILHKEVVQLIRHTHKETIEVLINRLGITDFMKNKVNQYRKIYGLEPV
jgi:RNA-directed DNA polymerase